MKTLRNLSLFALLAAVTASGCATHTGTGALAGGGLGAATGALIGSASGNAGKGALIGAGVGAATGGLLGNAQDEADRRNAARVAAATAPGPMTAQDVVYMTRNGVQEDTIISSIRSSNSRFYLTSTDVVDLRNQGVSDRVIQVMLSQRAGVQPVVVQPAPVVYVEPAPPPVSVGFGYTYVRPCRHW